MVRRSTTSGGSSRRVNRLSTPAAALAGCFHACLEPGGTLLLDKEVPWANARRWRYWTTADRKLPEPWPEESSPRRVPDGSEIDLRVRVLDLDPLDQRITFEMRAQRLTRGEVVAREEYVLTDRFYFPAELVLMLERAGFADVVVRGGYDDEGPTAEDDFLVFIARR